MVGSSPRELRSPCTILPNFSMSTFTDPSPTDWNYSSL
jgi:hypothetical protein